MRNFRKAEISLKILRRFYERLGWKDKVKDVDDAFYLAMKEMEAIPRKSIPHIRN